MASKKPRFSLVSLLLLISTIGAVLGLVMSWQELARLREEHQHVLEQTGYIDVGDPTKVYLRELDCPAPLTWRYQLYFPPGHQLQAGLGVELNEQGWPTRLLDSPELSRTGQYTLTVSLHHRDQRWRLSRYYANGGSDYRLVACDFTWLQEQEHQTGYSAKTVSPLHRPVQEFSVAEPIILLQLRNGSDSPDSTDGSLLVWLERDLKQDYRPPSESDTPTSNDQERQASWQSFQVRK